MQANGRAHFPSYRNVDGEKDDAAWMVAWDASSFPIFGGNCRLREAVEVGMEMARPSCQGSSLRILVVVHHWRLGRSSLEAAVEEVPLYWSDDMAVPFRDFPSCCFVRLERGREGWHTLRTVVVVPLACQRLVHRP